MTYLAAMELVGTQPQALLGQSCWDGWPAAACCAAASGSGPAVQVLWLHLLLLE